MTDTQDERRTDIANEQPSTHLLIAGTGRAGTSFLLRWLTELGLDTHLSRYGEEDAWYENANAGLETVPLPDHAQELPYVIKFAWLHQCIDEILAGKRMRLDAVIIPVRDLMEAATSRAIVELQTMREALPWMDEMDQSWEVWGKTPGGITYSLNPLDQGRILAVGFHHLVERLVRAEIPVVFLAFPRLVEDWRYLFDKLRAFLPGAASEDAAELAHRRLSDLGKVRVGAELEGAMRSGRIIKYPPHDQLDAIAVRRELARAHNALAKAETAAAQSREQADLARAARDAAAAEANAWREALTAANMRAATAQWEADSAQAAVDKASEAVRVAAQAAEEASKLRKALDGTSRALSEQIEETASLRHELQRLSHELQQVYASRSWRLTSGYRAIGRAIENLRDRTPRPAAATSDAATAPLSEVQTVPDASADTLADPWSRWPVWTGEESFSTKRFTFVTSISRFQDRSQDGVAILLKDRSFIDHIYRDLLRDLQPKRIFEIGFFQGGMPLFLADMVSPEKVVGIDYHPPPDTLKSMIAGAGLSDMVKLHGNVLQNNTALISQILDGEFGEQPLDLIVDDASHEYENSKACFETFFGYLRPGGKYILEDWGWLHWPGESWQTPASPFWGQPATTNLVFEVIMTLGSTHPKIIAKIEILSWACMVVTRGDGLAHRERVNLADTRLTCGRVFQPL